MKINPNVKPALWGAAGGVVLTLIVGFTWGGWYTAGSAKELAANTADSAVVEVLAPLCVANAHQDAESTKLAEFEALTRSYEQGQYITEAGWTTIPEVELTSRVTRDLRDACRAILLEQEPA